jgi:hypothetical protein
VFYTNKGSLCASPVWKAGDFRGLYDPIIYPRTGQCSRPADSTLDEGNPGYPPAHSGPAGGPLAGDGKDCGNGGSQLTSQLSQDFERLDALVRQVQATGAEIKDINTGLLDFRWLREG